ncbi:hypothetical protein Trydic_g23213 [Trypoxylus dichotomus]
MAKEFFPTTSFTFAVCVCLRARGKCPSRARRSSFVSCAPREFSGACKGDCDLAKLRDAGDARDLHTCSTRTLPLPGPYLGGAKWEFLDAICVRDFARFTWGV